MIYENVKMLCRERGISICQLEKACDIGNGVIGKWKDRKANPSIATVQKLEKYFGVSVDELLKEE